MRHRFCGSAVIVGLLCWTAGAQADDVHDAQYRPPPPERRADFAVGLSMTVGANAASGFPNEADKIDNPQYEQSTGANLGTDGSLWLGGALRDWFVIGFGLSKVSGQSGDKQLTSTSFITHLELYPLFSQGGAFRDLAVFGDFGAGGARIVSNDQNIANGGMVSTLGGGIVFEALRWGGFAAGPSVQYLHQYSPSLQSHFAGAGFRVAFYANGGR
ncbi:MAG TPA: hypothetical protein VHO25_18950 [Polyangiaceae bacterium]|nr:hypothetical protein [Polyangiaceae bacterium]